MGRYAPKPCRVCKRRFEPAYPNQRAHPGKCQAEWRRRYKREHQRRQREETKKALRDIRGVLGD